MTENILKKGNELKRELESLRTELKHFVEFRKEFFRNASKVEIRKDSISFGFDNDTEITDKDIIDELNDKIDNIINNRLKKLNKDIEELEKKFKEL